MSPEGIGAYSEPGLRDLPPACPHASTQEPFRDSHEDGNSFVWRS